MILGLLSSTGYAADKKECNSSDALQGWGIWCGVDSYLTQQEPTAAGPVDDSNPELGLPAVDSDKFGGSVEQTPYNWKGYAYVNVDRLNENIGGDIQSQLQAPQKHYLTGILQLQLEPDTNTVNVVMTLEDGSKITFNQQAQFITPQFGPDSSYGEFQVVSEDGKYQINALPALAIQRMTNDSVTSGGIRNIQDGLRIGGFAAGSPTPLNDMSSLAVNNIQATYFGSGDYRSSFGRIGRVYNDITVNFGNASWQGNWYAARGPGGFLNAQGSVTGNTFSSTSIGVAAMQDSPGIQQIPVVTGSIKGTFNGPNAGYLTGLVNVTVDENNLVGTFVNQKVEYNNEGL